MDLLPSNIELSGFEVRLINAMSRERVLKTYVNEVKKNYDYVLIDCMPSLGMITINALAAADSVVYPNTTALSFSERSGVVASTTANEGEAIENDLIYGAVSGKKSDEDGNALGGALIGIFKTGTEEFTTETAIATTTSEDDGSFSFAKVPYGNWIIREIESPTGYVLSDEEIPVTTSKVDEVVGIEPVNAFITGGIELTKVDKTATVKMHNELRETPKTGDDFNPAPWSGLAAVSMLGAGVLGFVGFKNKKKKED